LKSYFYFAASAVFLVLLSGCASKTVATPPKASAVQTECMQDGISAPSWICKPEVADAYASVGIAKGADKAQTIKDALHNGRAELVKQVQVQVREKLNNFALTPEGSNKEKVDNLYASIANAAKPEDLVLQEKLQSWVTSSGKVYIHVIASKPSIDAEVKKAVNSSYVNDQVTWLDFNSQQSITKLEQAFDIQLAKVKSVKVATLFQVESVADVIVGRNKKH
jgi:ribosomal silencing factor RsfS